MAWLAVLLAAGPLVTPPARDYELRELSNGLAVLMVVDSALPLATVEIAVRNGSMNAEQVAVLAQAFGA